MRRPRVAPENRKVNKVIPNIPIDTAGMVSEMPSGKRGHAIYDNDRFPYIAEVLCRNYGLTQAGIAPIFGVSVKAIEKWIQQYPDFKAAMVKGRDDFDSVKVEQTLLKRALGYKYTETTTKTVTLKRRSDEGMVYVPAVETTITHKELPADVKAIMFWLTNRNSERWKMVTTVNANIKSNTEHTERKLSVTADLSKMDSVQLRALRDMIEVQGKNAPQIEAEGNHNEMLQLLETAQSFIEDAHIQED